MDIRIIVVNVIWIISAVLLVVDNFVGTQSEDKYIVASNFVYDLYVPNVGAPLSMNFIFPVPEASLEAVEICSLMSAAAKISSALDTR